MKKFLLSLSLILFSTYSPITFAENTVYKAGIVLDDIPKALYGNWRVNAQLEDTNSYSTFKPASLDFWTLARNMDKVTLTNPFSGANAEISIKTVEGNLIVFSKKAPYDNKVLTDTITLRLNENTFTGINILLLETFSYVDNKLIKTETARYSIKGEKISGQSIIAN